MSMDRLGKWLHRYQEILTWLPAILAALLLMQWVIPWIDPRSGLDGWGTLWGMALVALAAAGAGFGAWLFEVTYRLEITDDDERELIDHACGIDRGDAGKRIGAGPPTTHALAVLALRETRTLIVFLALFWQLSP